MKKQTAQIKDLEKRLAEEIKANGENSKRAIFLKASINVNLKELGKAEKYSW